MVNIRRLRPPTIHGMQQPTLANRVFSLQVPIRNYEPENRRVDVQLLVPAKL
jgi:hypothetical protein